MAPWFTYSMLRKTTADDSSYEYNKADEGDMGGVYKKPRNLVAISFALLGGVALGFAISLFGVHVLTHQEQEKSCPPPVIVPAKEYKPIGSIDWLPKASSTSPKGALWTTKAYPDGQVIDGTQCGDSWVAARAMGCLYDPLSSRWYSPQCFLQEPFDDMIAQNEYKLYSDPEHTIEVPFSIAQKGEVETLYPNYDTAYTHCIYLWQKMQYALAHNLLLDDDLWEQGHTGFCTKKLLKFAPPNLEGSISPMHAGKPFCGRQPQVL